MSPTSPANEASGSSDQKRKYELADDDHPIASSSSSTLPTSKRQKTEAQRAADRAAADRERAFIKSKGANDRWGNAIISNDFVGDAYRLTNETEAEREARKTRNFFIIENCLHDAMRPGGWLNEGEDELEDEEWHDELDRAYRAEFGLDEEEDGEEREWESDEEEVGEGGDGAEGEDEDDGDGSGEEETWTDDSETQ